MKPFTISKCLDMCLFESSWHSRGFLGEHGIFVCCCACVFAAEWILVPFRESRGLQIIFPCSIRHGPSARASDDWKYHLSQTKLENLMRCFQTQVVSWLGYTWWKVWGWGAAVTQVTGGLGRESGVGGSKHFEAAKLFPGWGDPWPEW